MREEIGDLPLMADANQVWDVDEAIEWMRHLEPFDLRWIEEPTSPDDVLGHAAIRRAVAPVGVATGEHAANRVSSSSCCRPRRSTTARSTPAGSAASTRCWPCCCSRPSSAFRCARTPAASACASTCSTSASIDYVCVSGSLDDRTTEFADHLHEHFVHPAVVRDGHYVLPTAAGLLGRPASRLVRRARVPRRVGVAR